MTETDYFEEFNTSNMFDSDFLGYSLYYNIGL